MLFCSVYQDWNGAWVWEILDDEDLYLRCERSFECKTDAHSDLENASHLVRSQFCFH